MSKILIVEDDRELADALSDWLVGETHVVDIVYSGDEGLDRLTHYSYDLVVLDWALPGLPGIDVCKKFRAHGGTTPVIMLTGKSEIEHREQGLDAGADDYLTKPFHPKELSARLRALGRRATTLKPAVIESGNLKLDKTARKLFSESDEIKLLPREFSLIEFLMEHPKEVFSADTLLARVWSSESETSTDTVRVHITRLRNKLEKFNAHERIKTMHRVGYSFE
jgi:DNA-binding response OmpR family regulator